jgi:hypothetical protein
VLVAAAVIIPAVQAASAPVPVGTPFRIDDGSHTYMLDAAAAGSPGGPMVVVYQPDDPTATTPLMVQRLDSSGHPLGAAEPVASDGSSEDYAARVAVNAAGAFAVVWGTNDNVVHARAFAANGVPLGTEFRVDDAAHPLLVQQQGVSNNPPAYAVAIDGANRMLVVWTTPAGAAQPSQVGRPGTVVARRFTTAGTPVDAAPFTVSGGGMPVRSAPAVAMAPNGRFVVAWINSLSYSIPTGMGEQRINLDTSQVQFQRFSAAAVAQGQSGSGVQIGNDYTRSEANVSAAINDAGQFALSWDGLGDFRSVYLQRFTAAGVPSSARLSFAAKDSATPPRKTAVGIDTADDSVAGWSDTDHTAAAPLLDILNGIAPASTGQADAIGQQNLMDLRMGPNGDIVVFYIGVGANNAASGLFGQRFALQ